MFGVLFWIVSIGAVISCLYQIIIKKNLFGISTYILLGVYLPLFMSFLDWSILHVEDKGDTFYYIFVMLGLVMIVFNLLPQGKISLTNVRFAYRKHILPAEVYNLLFIGCVLLENYYVSGYFFPSLEGIDVHTMRMPYIYFLTTGVYIITVLNLIEFLITKKKRYVVYMIVSILINIISKTARVDAFICIVQVISFCAFYYFSKRDTIRRRNATVKKKRSKLPFLIILAVVLIVVVIYALKTGNDRMNHFGKYNYVYSDAIYYDGPEFLGEILPYYYGYFPLSFDNLAYNLEFGLEDIKLWGPNTFRTLWFGILQFDNIFGLNGSAAPRANIIRRSAAAVSTGFWDMYYDYGYLILIPIVVSFCIYMVLRKTVTRQLVKVQNFVLYFYWVPLWFFMSFDNRVYDFQILWHVAIMYLIMGSRYVLYYDEHPHAVEEISVGYQRRRQPRIRIKWRGNAL